MESGVLGQEAQLRAEVPEQPASPPIFFPEAKPVAVDTGSNGASLGPQSPSDVATRARRRLPWRGFAIGLGGLVVAGVITAGVISDVSTRRSLDASQRDVAASSAKLQAANAQLAVQGKELQSQAGQLAALRSTAADDQATIAGQQQQNQQLTACTGALTTFFQDLAANQISGADRDYRLAFGICDKAGVQLPLP